MKTKATCLAIVVMAFSVSQSSLGQLGGGGERVNVEFIPRTAVAGAAVFPRKIADDPKFDLFPREIVTAWGVKELGFDPMLIRQITFIVKKMDDLDRPPQWAAILHFEQMQGLAGSLIDRLEEKKVGGKAMFSGGRVGMPSFLIYDEATIFVGDEEFFGEMVAADKSGKLVNLIRSSSVKGQVLGFADIESARPALNQLLAGLPGFLPPAITKLKTIPDFVEAIEIGIKAEGRLQTTVILHASDDDKAQQVNEIITESLEFGSEMMLGMMAAQLDFNDPVQEALVEYAQRVSDDYQKKLTPIINGSEMMIQLDQEATILPFALGLLIPAVESSREAARRSTSMNNTRQMVLAMHNYESVTGTFPAQGSYDKNGKPLLSWRVHVLPYIDQQDLYEQFHLDESWNSRHNKRLIKQMPPVYMSPSVGYNNDGKTVYLGVAGDGFAFGKEGRTISDFTDGTSNTVLTLEVNSEQAVIWTQPEDWSFDENRPLEGLGSTQKGGFIASFADGSVHFILPSVDPATWKALLTIGGREVINGF